MAPEVLDHQVDNNQKMDIWSIGIITYTLLVGEYPYNRKPKDCNEMKQMAKKFAANLQ